MRWKEISFGEIIKERKGLIEPNDPSLFQYDKIEKIDFSRGDIFLTKYSPTKTKQIIVFPDDFVFSGLNIEKGAVSINSTGQKLVVSANYSTCEVNYSQIDKDYFLFFMKSNAFKTILKENLKKDYGFTRPKHLNNLKFAIPETLELQKTVVKQLRSLESLNLKLQTEISDQLDLVEQLRQAFLREAMQGKLVQQDPNDEPASVLLEKIKAEKERLVKEKVIRKGKLQEAETLDELLFDIPNHWVWCKLDSICKNITDGTHQTPTYTKSGRMFLSAQNVKPFKFMPKEHKFVSEEAYQVYIKNRKPERGDLLIGRVGAGIGETAVIDQDLDFCIYVSLGLVQPFKEYVDSNYLAYVFNSPYGYSYAKGNISSKGGSAGNFNLGRIRSFLIPLPPLSEQQRIVAKLDELMQYCDELEASIKESQQQNEFLLQQVLREALEPKEKEVVG